MKRLLIILALMFVGCSAIEPQVVECPADLNGDGSVGAEDLALVLGSWGLCLGGGCNIDDIPMCFEGASCCSDDTWQCNDFDTSPTCLGCEADLNGDGMVNAVDQTIVLGSWGSCKEE